MDKKEELISLIYGTKNPGKLQFMKRSLSGLPILLEDLQKAAEKEKIVLPEIKETGNSPLENARIKAKAYYALFRRPVFSCDSGLYLWSHETGRALPDKVQPGVYVRGRGKKRLTDEELLSHYIGLVKEYGSIEARYQNAICLVWEKESIFESEAEDLWGEAFLLTDKPHEKRVPGFPLDSISKEISTGRYYYDIKFSKGDFEENSQDNLAAAEGFAHFFADFFENKEVAR